MRMLDQQSSIVASGVTITRSFANSSSAPMPARILGKNVFSPITFTPVTQAFAGSLTRAGGNPFTVTAPNTTGLHYVQYRANRLCNGRSELKNQNLRTNGGYFFDTSCFAAPAVGYFGTSGFNILSGPGLNNWDIGIHKDIPIREALRMQFRTEFFNAFNHAQFANPDSGWGDTNFGKVTSTQANAREIQFALELLW